jgi:hypothetical protein
MIPEDKHKHKTIINQDTTAEIVLHEIILNISIPIRYLFIHLFIHLLRQ